MRAAAAQARHAPPLRQVWILVVVAVLSATMSESAIDSLQNAIVDNISGSFLKDLPLIWVRALVLVLNVPVIVVSLQVWLLAPAACLGFHYRVLALNVPVIVVSLQVWLLAPAACLGFHYQVLALNVPVIVVSLQICFLALLACLGIYCLVAMGWSSYSTCPSLSPACRSGSWHLQPV